MAKRGAAFALLTPMRWLLVLVGSTSVFVSRVACAEDLRDAATAGPSTPLVSETTLPNSKSAPETSVRRQGAAPDAGSTQLDAPEQQGTTAQPSTSALAHPSRPSVRERPVWYGWQTLVADGAALVTGIAGAHFSSEELGYLTAGGYVLGGPIVHLTRENFGRAGASLALRVGLPLTFASVGAAAANCEGSEELFCGIGEVVIGGLIGVTTAIALDAAVLARDSELVEEEASLRLGLEVGKKQALVIATGSF